LRTQGPGAQHGGEHQRAGQPICDARAFHARRPAGLADSAFAVVAFVDFVDFMPPTMPGWGSLRGCAFRAAAARRSDFGRDRQPVASGAAL
jgi:hypothetical protein